MDDRGENIKELRAEVTQGKEETINNPWRNPIKLITWGFLMTSFTLNFFLLQYILPTIGVGLLYLGFLNMRKGNRTV